MTNIRPQTGKKTCKKGRFPLAHLLLLHLPNGRVGGVLPAAELRVQVVVALLEAVGVDEHDLPADPWSVILQFNPNDVRRSEFRVRNSGFRLTRTLRHDGQHSFGNIFSLYLCSENYQNLPKTNTSKNIFLYKFYQLYDVHVIAELRQKK